MNLKITVHLEHLTRMFFSSFGYGLFVMLLTLGDYYLEVAKWWSWHSVKYLGDKQNQSSNCDNYQ